MHLEAHRGDDSRRGFAGHPGHRQTLDEIVATARREAWLYQEAGVNCLMLENMHDVPYLRGSVGPEIVASMTMIARAIRDVTDLPVGLQILAAADIEAMAVAHAAGLDFIRTECFSFAHVGDEGIMESNAAKLLRYRRTIGAAEVQVWADIKKKHASHAWTGDSDVGRHRRGGRVHGRGRGDRHRGQHGPSAATLRRGGSAWTLPTTSICRLRGN